MKKEEKEARIKELENRLFFIHMKDFWTFEDKENIRRFEKEIEELKK